MLLLLSDMLFLHIWIWVAVTNILFFQGSEMVVRITKDLCFTCLAIDAHEV
jgi:hypothetical protein